VPVLLEVNRLYSSDEHTRFEALRFRSFCRLLEEFAINQASVVATVSTPLAAFVQELATDRSRVIVLPNGANPELFRPRPELRDKVRDELAWTDSVIVGWAGILREWHGVELLIRAVARVPNLKLLIIGDGPDRSRLDAIVERLALSDRVMFTGRVSHADVVRYIAAVDVAVSSADRTGIASPMKLLEYMAMERATVAPRLPNIQDLIDDNADGLLFEPDNEQALSSVLRRLADDPALRLRLGKQARLKVMRHRNWQRNAEIVVRAITQAARLRPVSQIEQLGTHL
jgi:glycosyltransferase involved in cell wall biosynthesis